MNLFYTEYKVEQDYLHFLDNLRISVIKIRLVFPKLTKVIFLSAITPLPGRAIVKGNLVRYYDPLN